MELCGAVTGRVLRARDFLIILGQLTRHKHLPLTPYRRTTCGLARGTADHAHTCWASGASRFSASCTFWLNTTTLFYFNGVTNCFYRTRALQNSPTTPLRPLPTNPAPTYAWDAFARDTCRLVTWDRMATSPLTACAPAATPSFPLLHLQVCLHHLHGLVHLSLSLGPPLSPTAPLSTNDIHGCMYAARLRRHNIHTTLYDAFLPPARAAAAPHYLAAFKPTSAFTAPRHDLFCVYHAAQLPPSRTFTLQTLHLPASHLPLPHHTLLPAHTTHLPPRLPPLCLPPYITFPSSFSHLFYLPPFAHCTAHYLAVHTLQCCLPTLPCFPCTLYTISPATCLPHTHTVHFSAY